jgi:hypothetical protein
MRGTLPDGVSSHSMNPGTFSLISPPPAEVGGPQQGGLSLAGCKLQHATSTGEFIFRMLLILNG